jgi:hypothetical protein
MLSEMAVRQAKAKDKDYKLSDSEGLYLFVAKSGRRSWRFKYRFAGKERRLIFGAYPEVSLKEARDRKVEARKLLAEGRDPGLEAKKAAIARAMSASNTFEVVARSWFVLQEDRWTPVHARDVISSLEKEVFPWIGALPIAELDEPIVLSVLRTIEKRGAIETAHRVRQRMSAVFVQAIAEVLSSWMTRIAPSSPGFSGWTRRYSVVRPDAPFPAPTSYTLANTRPDQFVWQLAGDITYRCNVLAGFTRTITS